MTEPPPGAAYTEHRLRVTRTARWGLIGALGDATTDAWIALHGYGQLAATFAAAATWPVRADRAVVFPEALQRFYDSDWRTPRANNDAPVVASWMTRDARADDIADNHAYLDTLWRTVRDAAPHASLTVFGFSQGAATAARWCASLAARGTPPARLILWGGAIPEETELGPEAPLRRVPVTFVFGSRDRWATPERADAELSRLTSADFPFEVYRFDGGHRLDNATLAELAG